MTMPESTTGPPLPDPPPSPIPPEPSPQDPYLVAGPPPPPYASFPPPPFYGFAPPQQARNGLGVTALVTGIIGVVLGFVPFLFWLSGLLGLLALVFGLVGHSRARQGLATNKTMALVGTILGGLAMLMAIVGLVLTVMFVKTVENKVKHDERLRSTQSAAASDPSADKPLRFGETQAYEDGVTVTVAKPEAYDPSPSAYGLEKGDLALQVKITIVNGSTQPIDIRTALPSMRDGKGAAAQAVFDGGSTKPFEGELMPGKQAMSQFTYSVAPEGAKDVQVDVAPNAQRDEASWTASGQPGGNQPSVGQSGISAAAVRAASPLSAL